MVGLVGAVVVLVVGVAGVAGVVLVDGLVGVVLVDRLVGVVLLVELVAGEATSSDDLLDVLVAVDGSASTETPVSNSKDRVTSTDKDGNT